MEIMKFDEFVYFIQSQKEGEAEIQVMEYREDNRDCICMVIRKKGSIVGNMTNLEYLYKSYMAGMSKEKVLECIDGIIASLPVLDSKCLSDPEYVKPRLFIRVCNLERNKEYLEKVPYEVHEDLAVTCHVLIEKSGGENHSATINNERLKLLGFTKEELFAIAKKNAADILPAKVINFGDAMHQIQEETGQIILSHEEYEGLKLVPLYVLTNRETTDGASVLFYPDLMARLAERLGGSYYIFLVSVNEIIIVPLFSSSRIPFLKMEMEVKRKVLNPEEVLTENMYYYDAMKKKFSISK